MKLYMHPVSNASRPVRLYIAENKLPVEEQLVDLMTGEHYKEPYVSINPNRLVPTLEEDDGWRLTESAAILKYLAVRFEQPHYPSDLRKRAKIDEAMDWFNTQFYRDYGYGLAYPQIFPHHKRPTDEFHQGVIAWGKEKSRGWFQILDTHWLGGGKPYLTGDQITVADYFGASLVTLGEVIKCDFAQFPNVDRWIGNMKQLRAWGPVNEAMAGFANMVKDNAFVSL